MLEGFWVNDVNKTGEMVDFDRDNASNVNQYQLPKVIISLGAKFKVEIKLEIFFLIF